MKVLALHAHPDDIEILAGGTLALLRKQGHSVVMASMTPGDCGSSDKPAVEIAAIRRQEATASAALIGADYQCLEFRDMTIFSDDPSRRRVVEFLRVVQPDVVLTASPKDYLCDHEATSALVRDACFAASIPNYGTGSAPIGRIPHLYFMDPIEEEVVPDLWVDIASVFAMKREMLAKHESQRDWLRKQHGMDNYLDEMERWTRGRGKQAGCGFAEGFRQYTTHPFPKAAGFSLPEARLLSKRI
ncbi:MAG: PIG-L family deacetylase [Acidobacteriota bacterium]|nr:PIG-L family deacetylase [Acidobacteriota bacterium]